MKYAALYINCNLYNINNICFVLLNARAMVCDVRAKSKFLLLKFVNPRLLIPIMVSAALIGLIV